MSSSSTPLISLLRHPVQLFTAVAVPWACLRALDVLYYGASSPLSALATPPLSCALLLATFLNLHRALATAFFGRVPSDLQARGMLKTLGPFLSFRMVLIGLVLHPSAADVVAWMFWCSLLTLTKALMHQSVAVSDAVTAHPVTLRHILRPLLHLTVPLLVIVSPYYTSVVY
jgi:hypothetical protein